MAGQWTPCTCTATPRGRTAGSWRRRSGSNCRSRTTRRCRTSWGSTPRESAANPWPSRSSCCSGTCSKRRRDGQVGTVSGMNHLTQDGPASGQPVPGPMTVVIVDDHQMVLDGLKAMLAPYRDQVEIVGESSDPGRVVRLVNDLKPDAVLLDVRLRGASGLDLCAEILRVTPGCKVVFLTVYDDEQYLYQALRVGAAGFLLKRIRGGELVDYLRRISDGEVLIDPSLAGRVALSAARLRSGEFWPGAHLGLTQRESEVLSLLVAGLSNRAVAMRLVVSEETVKTHSRGIYRKLGVSDRAGAVAVALREGVFH